MTLKQLKTRAKKRGLTIRKYERGEDSYVLVDISTNAVAVPAPTPMTLKQVELWLVDLDNLTDE